MSKDISVNLNAILAWLNTGTATVTELDYNEADTLEAIVAALANTTIYTPAVLWTGVTAGTVTASRVVSVDANRDVATLRNVTLDGALALGVLSSIALGTLSSANDTSGVHLTAAKSKAVGIYADTGGVALTAGFVRAASSRFLIGTAISSGADISTAGFEGLLKMIVSVNVGGNQAGVMGHLESAGTLTLTGSSNVVKSGVSSFVDLATGATIAAGTVVSAFGVHPANLTGVTVTGRTTVIHVTAPVGAYWGSLIELPSTSDACQAAAAGTTPGPFVKLYINGVLHTIATVKAP
jgi:hypothetical protein